MMGVESPVTRNVTHGKGHLANVGLPDPQEHAKSSAAATQSQGGDSKGDGKQHLGVGDSFTSGSINHIPGKGSGEFQDKAGPARNLPHPFGSAGTRNK